MFIVRYADDFRIFSRTKSQAEVIKYYITKWLKIRLKLDVSPEKTRIVNVKKKYSLFFGFKINAQKKKKKWVVKSHICEKAAKKIISSLKEQARRIKRPKTTVKQEILLYNLKVMGIHNYYEIATDISQDMKTIGYIIDHTFKARLKGRSKKTGGKLIHDDLTFSNNYLIDEMVRKPYKDVSIEYADNRLSLFSAQYGRCAITGYKFERCEEIACHHIKPKSKGGEDNYQNLVIIRKEVHRLIHAARQATISKYIKLLNLAEDEIKKVNRYRKAVGLKPIAI